MALISLNGVTIPSFVRVSKITRPVHPSVERTTIQIPGRHGSYAFANRFTDLTISLDFGIAYTDKSDADSKILQLSQWLYYDDPVPLLLPFSSKYYMVQVTDTNWDELIKTGTGTITFLCIDPFRYGNSTSTTIAMNGKGGTSIVNDSMATDSDGDGVVNNWSKNSVSGATVAWSLDDSAQKINVTASTSAALFPTVLSANFPVVVGTTYDFSADVKMANRVGTFEAFVQLDWRNSSGTQVSSNNSPVVNTNSTNNAYTTITATATAPAGATTVILRCMAHVIAIGDTGTAWFRNACLFSENTTGIDATPVTITNNGNVDTFPIINLDFTQNLTDFMISTADSSLIFGQTANVDTYTAVDGNVVQFTDTGTTLTGWTTGATVDGGAVAGTMVASGNNWNASGYGAGSTWHGPAMIKDLGAQLQDFNVETHLNMFATANNQIGRVELYLLDINGAIIGKVAMRDSTGTKDYHVFEARAGTLASGKVFANSEAELPKSTNYANFFGHIIIQRKGTQWYAEVGRKNTDGTYSDRWSKTFYDKSSLYTAQLAKIQIHIGMYNASPVIPTLNITSVKVIQYPTITPTTQVPYTFKSGDHLTIDCTKGIILINGQPHFEALDPASRFIALHSGANTITATPTNFTNMKITYQERYR